MAYDDEFLYIASKCYSRTSHYVVPTLRRDFRAGGNDNLTYMFDTYADGNNCFFFGTNPLGVQREGLITNGGQVFQDFSGSWDNKWECEAVIHEGFWTSEMKIPFSSIRFKDAPYWRFNSYRFNIDRNETSTWINIPQNQVIFSLAFMGDIVWDKKPESQGTSIGIIPFATTALSKDYEEDTDVELSYGFGGDVKIPVGTGLNLDLTFNPDFSQVEVDRQVTNLDRFEIFFPERRQFFLENADLFSGFGFSNINPFFSRRIGVATDTTEDVNIQNRILGGARLSGKLNNDWRLGVLSMQTEEDAQNALPSFNYSVLAIQRKLWSRSNLGFIFINKNSVGNKHDEYVDPFNRVVGLDFNYATKSNRWSGKTFLHQSLNHQESDLAISHGFNLRFNQRNYRFNWQHEFVSEDYDAQVGFIRRKNYLRIQPRFERRNYPDESWFQNYGIVLSPQFVFKPDFGRTDHIIELSLGGSGRQFQRVNLSLVNQFVHLFDDFDPTGSDQETLESGTNYTYTYVTARYNTNRSKNIFARFNPTIGQYFNGKRYGISGSINFRYQPIAEIGLNYNFNIFDMPHLGEKVKTFLIGPRIDLTFSKELFLTSFVQFNSQSENTNVNTRLQWRFAPVSDFFLVYTDNYFTGNVDPSDRFLFNIRNRALVMKWTYWLNT